MSAARSVVDALVDVLADAVDAPVVIDTGQAVPQPDPVLVRAVSLDRVGRSQRAGPVLDLSLVVEVLATGPQALETAERLLLAVERSPWCVRPQAVAVGQLSPPQDLQALRRNGIGFTVQLPVSIPIAEPTPPLVTQVPVVRVEPVRSAQGRLVDRDGTGISGASVRSSSTGAATVTDEAGQFRLLSVKVPTDVLVAEVDGRRLGIETRTQASPLVIEWNGTDPAP